MLKCYKYSVILAIETSCDDTCAAVVEHDGRRALSNVVHTQTEHDRYGGVVPEVASRAHLERIDGVVEKSLVDAKTDLEPPFVALIASGGHTALYSVDENHGMQLLGETLDDAAGEALDKGARMLGLGFPGGPALQRAAHGGDRERYDFPVALKGKYNLDFSFSGLKTSLLYKLKDLGEERACEELSHLAASYEAAVVEALARKLLRAADLQEAPVLVVAGGVAANALLRRTLEEERERLGFRLVIPPPELCTDNAAMIGAAAPHTQAVAYPHYLSLNARSI